MKKKLPFQSGHTIFLQELLRGYTDNNYFGSRRSINDEWVSFLLQDKEFQENLKDTQIEFNIPKLVVDDDIVEGFYYDEAGKDAHVTESEWLKSQPSLIQESIHKRILDWILLYGLPQNFYDWFECYLLYGKPPWKPLYNFELIFQIMDDFKELERIPPTSQEKKFIKERLRSRLGIKRRPPKEIQKAYKEFLKKLSETKNKKRRMRSFQTAIKTLDKGKIDKFYDPVAGKDITEKPSYKKLAVRLKKNASEDERDKLANKLRKNNERLRKRMKIEK